MKTFLPPISRLICCEPGRASSLNKALRFGGKSGRQQSVRHLWKFTHFYMPERKPDGQQPQRKPSEHPDFTKYNAEYSKDMLKAAPPIKLILLQQIPRWGELFDAVEVPPGIAHGLLTKQRACYASPFDLQYYEPKRQERLTKEAEKKIHLPKDLIRLGHDLASRIILLHVSMRNEWTLNRDILSASLREQDIAVPFECIHMGAGEPMKGPNLKAEAKLIRFYLTIQNQLIVPMAGRIAHLHDEEDDKQSLIPEDVKKKQKRTDQTKLSRSGLRPETLYYNRNGLDEAVGERGVAEFMAGRPEDAAVTGLN